MKVYIKATNVADIEAKIANKQAIIDKKNAWIAKKETSIAKKLKIIEQGVTPDDYIKIVDVLEWLKDNNGYRRPEEYSLSGLRRKYIDRTKEQDLYDIIGSAEDDAESIYTSKQAIAEETAIMEKHQAKLSAIIEKDAEIDEIPDCLKEFMNDVIQRWDDYDLNIKNNGKPYYYELRGKARKILYEGDPYERSATKKARLAELYPDIEEDRWGWEREKRFERDNIKMPFELLYGSLRYAESIWDLTDEKIHAYNEKSGKDLILDLLNRVTKITGPVVDWTGLHVTRGNMGLVINGVVIGEEGKAEVESIYASGPVQRLHIRTLVKPIR